MLTGGSHPRRTYGFVHSAWSDYVHLCSSLSAGVSAKLKSLLLRSRCLPDAWRRTLKWLASTTTATICVAISPRAVSASTVQQ